VNIGKIQASLDLSKIPPPKMPKVKVPKNPLTDVGSVIMKIKLIMGFVQCISIFPKTFRSVEWPEEFKRFSSVLNIFSIDLFGLLGNECAFKTGFYPKFLFQMAIVPGVLGLTAIAFLLFKILAPILCKKRLSNVTTESIKSAIFEILFLVIYTLYTSISTSIFELFNCHKIQGEWYLIADYTKKCSGPEYNSHLAVGFVGMAFFTVGIPLTLFFLMWSNRKVLFPDDCEGNDELKRHATIFTMYGSMYEDYKPSTFFFDLLDLFRRLMLTGGLMLLGTLLFRL